MSKQHDSMGAMSQEEFDEKFLPLLKSIDKWKLPDCIRKMEKAVALMLRNNKKQKRIEKIDQLAESRLEARKLNRTFRQIKRASSSLFVPAGAPNGYREYLKSDEWQQIRARVLGRDGGRCLACGERASQVHHMKYNEATMRGATLIHLISICGDCHQDIHFLDGVKMSADVVHRRLSTLRFSNFENCPLLLDGHIDWESVFSGRSN
jgi:hypothetical protein